MHGPFMTRCVRCGANVPNLALIPVINAHREKTRVEDVYEMSTYGATLGYLKRTFANVIESEYFPRKAPGQIIDGIRNEDVQCLSFADASLDLITSNQVFEHVPDDVLGYRECFRALRPGGALVMAVPLGDRPETLMAAEVIGDKIVHHMEPQYHDSRRGGPRSALVFWHHSVNDICSRIARAGFEATLVNVVITPVQQVPQRVIYAVKPHR
jgi:SAM-dependent methyltransferase